MGYFEDLPPEEPKNEPPKESDLQKALKGKFTAAAVLYGLGAGTLTAYILSICFERNATRGILWTIVMLLLAAALIFFAVRSTLAYSRLKKENGVKLPLERFKAPLIGATVIFLVPCLVLGVGSSFFAERLVQLELFARYGGVLSGEAEGAELPENAHYLFYNAEKNCFEFPSGRENPYAAQNVFDVGVVVTVSMEYRAGGGIWVYSGTNKEAAANVEKTDTYRLIRTDNGGVICSGTTTVDIPGKTTSDTRFISGPTEDAVLEIFKAIPQT